MKSKFLFPAWCNIVGFLMAIPGLILGYFCVYYDYQIQGFGLDLREKETFFLPKFENFTNELALVLTVIGLLFIAFSMRKREDELTAKLRFNALYWAVIANYVVFYIFVIFKNLIYGSPLQKIIWGDSSLTIDGFSLFNDLDFLIYNLFTPLVIFIARYYYLLYKKRDQFVIKNLYYVKSKPYKKIGIWISCVIVAVFVMSIFISSEVKWFNSKYIDFGFYLLPISLFLWGYSKEKNEEEIISQFRMESLQLATYINYSILIILTLTVFSTWFLVVLYANFITLLLCYILIFEYKKYVFFKQDEQKIFEEGMSYEK